MSQALPHRRTPWLAALPVAVVLASILGCHSNDSPTAPRIDVAAPVVISTSPANGATGVPANQVISATFSEPMNEALTRGAFSVRGPFGTLVAGAVTYDAAADTVRFTPSTALPPATTFTATITVAAHDLAGRALASPQVWSFTTGPFVDVIAPIIILTVPSNGATGVARSQTITATFSEAMNAASITDATFSVSGPGATPVAGVVAYDAPSRVASFSPTAPLAANTTFTARVTTGARDVAGNPMAADRTWTFTTGTDTDTVAPTVIATVPVNGATGVALNQVITARFSEAMSAATINAASFTLTGPGATPVAGVVAYDAATRVARFTPSGALAASTTFTATISTAVRDLAGNAMATPKVWSFTTGTATDTVAPTVVSTAPVNGATGVPLGQVVTATFSEAMNAATINAATFGVTGPGGTPVAGTVTLDAPTNVARFTPSTALAASTTYTATITTGVRDVAGNAMATNRTWSFTTGTGIDSVAPRVTMTVPAAGATGVPTNQVVTATFSEAMNAATITSATFTLTGPGITPVAGAVAYDAATRVASFTPTFPLATSTTFTARISTGARDLAGNAMAASHSWSFTTGATADTVAPSVLATVPVNGAIGVDPGQAVTASFSEAMNAATITPASFTLTGPGGAAVTGAVAYDAATRVASFTPASALAPSTTYAARITTGARDLAGNAMAADHAWSFTTGTGVDRVPPTVLFTVPAQGATGVDVHQTLSATFSEAMNAATITDMTFLLSGPGAAPLTGLVLYDALTREASFKPDVPLAPSTTYTATITTGVTDLAGNAMALDKTWSFTTANQPGVPLGAVSAYAVLAGSTVTNTGPTVLVGDLGVSPGTAVTGFPPGIVTGTIHAGDPDAAAAKRDLDRAYNDAAGRSDAPITVSGNLGGMTLPPGLYKSTSSLEISSGDLTLDAQGDSNAVFIFQMASTLTTTPGRAVILSGGANAANVYWQVGTSATLGVGSTFKGTIMADQSITLNTGASLDGRAVTRIGAVTLSSNSITVPN